MHKEMYPLVSVAIVTFNQKDFLRECIESILEQDYPNFEIVVADDASTDGTQEMLKEYYGKYKERFVLKLSEVNQGITVNSNNAHFACSGKYIAWMGGDDLMLPGKLSNQVAFMESNLDCSICYHNLEVFNSKTGEVIRLFNNDRNSYEGGVEVAIRYGTFNGACSNMVRAEDAPSKGFNTQMPVASDWLYWIETLANGGKIKYINKTLGRYRRHDSNVTNKTSVVNQNVIDHFTTCGILLKLYPEHFSSIMSSYSRNMLSLRFYSSYGLVLVKSFFLSPNFRSIAGLLFYFISFGKIKK